MNNKHTFFIFLDLDVANFEHGYPSIIQDGLFEVLKIEYEYEFVPIRLPTGTYEIQVLLIN